MRHIILFGALWASAGVAWAGGDWVPVAGSGIDLASNTALSALHQFGGKLYVGTENACGARIYRSEDCATFTAVMTDGFGDGVTRINDFEEFCGYLYAGTSSPCGGSVYRSCDGTTWELASPVGLGSEMNTDVLVLTSFSGALYAGTKNVCGCGAQLWKSTDGTTWTSVTTSGFGDSNNTAINDLLPWLGNLHAATSNASEGGQLVQIDSSDCFIILVNDGFGNPCNAALTSLEVMCEQLYIGTRNANGYEVWATPDDVNFDIHASGGLGNEMNVAVTDLHLAGPALYIGVESSCAGFEVSRTFNGWEFNQEDSDGFGDPGNFRTNQFATFMNKVWTGTSNSAGGELFQTELVCLPPEPDPPANPEYSSHDDHHDDHHDDQHSSHHSHSHSPCHCFVATAAYGSPGAPRITELRRLRDERIEACESGRNFTDLYRNTAPPVAKVIRESEVLRALVRKALLK